MSGILCLPHPHKKTNSNFLISFYTSRDTHHSITIGIEFLFPSKVMDLTRLGYQSCRFRVTCINSKSRRPEVNADISANLYQSTTRNTEQQT